MPRWIPLSVAMLFLAALSGRAALAQADAQAAYQQAKAAFEAGKFAEARDLAQQASQTDNRNPEVFLLLGKAHYQLGQLDEAMAAWQRTLQLAPEEPYAKQMLDALRGKLTEYDARVKLIRMLIDQKLLAPAGQQCAELLKDNALSDTQRVKVWLLQAEVDLGQNQPAQALEVIEKLRARQPEPADQVTAALLEGQAKLRIGGPSTAEGLELLYQVMREPAENPAVAVADYELATFRLKQGATPERAEALAAWLAAHADHPLARDARPALLAAWLDLSGQTARPQPDATLNPFDLKAKALIEGMAAKVVQADQVRQLFDRWLKHVEARYAANGAYAAAIEAVRLPAPAAAGQPAEQPAVEWPSEVRLASLKALGSYQTQLWMRDLEEQARAGSLPAEAAPGQLPRPLAEIVAVYGQINEQFPAQPAWGELADLAARVRQFASRVSWPAAGTTLKGPDAWAVTIAVPVVKANADQAAVQKMVELFQGLINDYSGRKDAAGQKLTVELSRRLVDAPLSPEHPAWPGVTFKHAELLAGYSHFLFEENLKAGKAEQNAKPSPPLVDMVDTLGRLLARNAEFAAQARELVHRHVLLWHNHGQAAVVDEIYGKLIPILPAAERRKAELAQAGLWIERVNREHQRLAAAGLKVPEQLDPTHAEALKRCYQLQAGLPPESPELAEIRKVWTLVPSHYQELGYEDVAAEAIRLKPEQPVAAADEYAAFALVQLKDQEARRELARLLKQYGAKQQIELTPALKEVLAGWQKFIADYPQSPLTPQAVEQTFGVGRLLEQQQAFAVAAGVYADFAAFAAGVPVLSQAAPGETSTAERALFTRAVALDAQARKLLSEAMKDRKEGTPPPEKLSDEFVTAIGAYKGFIEKYPESPLVADALGRVMGVAYEYARQDAWDVADGVYADLLASKLTIARPERLQFARGLCALGRAMPDHAKEILNVLTGGGWRASGETPEVSTLAEAGGMAWAGFGSLGGRSGQPGGGGAVAGPVPATETPPPPRTPPAQPAIPSVATMPGGASISGVMPGADLLVAGHPSDESVRDSQLLAMIRQQEAGRAAQVAQLRENLTLNYALAANQPVNLNSNALVQIDQQAAQGKQQVAVQQAEQRVAVPALSQAELARQQKAIDAAYEIFQAIRTEYPTTPTAEQARGEILVMVSHWRELTEWERAAGLAQRYLADNPKDQELPKLRLEIARDRLAWATKPIDKSLGKQAMLAEVSKRFAAARDELAKVVAEFPEEKTCRQQAQWDIANSFLTEARVVAALSPTLARGQFVRAAKELQAVAEQYADHPRIGEVPQMLWNIAAELENRGFDEEAIVVWNDLTIYDPLSSLAEQAATKIAGTYQQKLNRPLKAAEVYQELNFARGGGDEGLQNAIFQIGSELKNQKRWVEALHVLETFVDSFPRHPQAGQALTMVGQIHQTNEAWEDAITAYRRVIAEFEDGQFVVEAKWAIAECEINLSRWQEAIGDYRNFASAYAQDSRVAEANRRIEVLKDLVRYQGLVDEKGQRKAFDAQYQIAEIVRQQLSNPVKAIIEYRKVVTNWPESHLADDALYAVGTAYLSLDETQKGRDALREVAEKYPTSPLADDALYAVGQSFEQESQKLATVTRESTMARNWDVAQRYVYEQSRINVRRQQDILAERVASLKQAGKGKAAELEEASVAGNLGQFNEANVKLFAQKAQQEVEALTAAQLADRQDKINAALRKAVEAYQQAAQVPGGDKADEALLQMATIYDTQLKDSKAAMQTWLEIVRQFSGTSVAEDASWRIAQYYEREGNYDEAVKAYEQFLRNYRRSPKAGDAQFAIAENYERLGQWVPAMDAYTNYINNFPEGPLVAKAKEQINWIKTYRL